MSDSLSPGSTQPGTKQRLISAMSVGLQRHGLHATGINDVLRRAGAPRGVLYHHFPDGKTALAVASIEESIAEITGWLDFALEKYPDPLEAIERWVRAASRRLSESDFEAGCPLATIALETTSDDTEVRNALAAAFAELRARMSQALTNAGVANSEGLATLIVAAYEGGLLQARVANSVVPLQLASEMLGTLIRAWRAPVGTPA
jgi:TetR/AcrR family transcriptional repressor of lmrAB and yxaGH operons